MADKIVSHEETIRLLNERAKAVSDNFYVKVSRRAHLGSMPTMIATFSGAQVVHVANPETWLPRIAGGGPTYLLNVYHADEPTMLVGSPLVFSVATENCPPKEIDPLVVKAAGWNGPARLEWPDENAKKYATPQPSYQIASPSSPVRDSASGNVPGGGPGMQYQPDFRREFEQLSSERARLERVREEFEERQRQMELDTIRRESEARIREMETKVMHSLQTPKQDASQTIAAMLTAAAPILQQMLASQNETRLAVMKQQEAAAMQQQHMFQMMMQRPSVDPAVEKAFDRLQNALEKKSNEAVPQTQMLHSMAEAMGTMTSMTMDLVQTAAELNLGGRQQDDHPALKAIKEGVKAMNSLFSGYQQAANIPRAQPQPQPQPQQLPAHAQQQAAFEQAARAQAPQPAQAPVPARAAPVPARAAPAPQGFAEFDFANAPGSVVDRLEAMIKAKADPSLVAKTFIDSLDDEDLQKALAEVDGQINELVARRLGAWAMNDAANALYLRTLLKEVNAQGAAAGIFEGEGDDEEEDDEEDSEG